VLEFFATPCAFLQNTPLQSIPYKKAVLNSNFYTKIVYEASKKHVYRSGGGRVIQTL
jgi:hypothetical protein